MSAKAVEYDQVFIDMKTKITSYGPHDGFIVYCGIQQEPNIFWPCVLTGAYAISSQRFNVASTAATVHWPTMEDNQRSADAPYVSDRHYQLTDKKVVSLDDCDTRKKVCLNIFEVNPVTVERKSFGVMPRNCNSYSSSAIVENEGVQRARKSLTTEHNIDCHNLIGNAQKAVTEEASNQNLRIEHMVRCGKDRQHVSITEVDSNLIPVKQFYEKTAASCKHYTESSDKFVLYCYNQTEKDFASYCPSTGFPVTADPVMDNEFTNGIAVSPGLAAQLSNQQPQQYGKPDLYQVPASHRNVPEQLYHLYETQDALGNLLNHL